MCIGEFNIPFINAMVRSMYDFEANMVGDPNLLDDTAIHEFYLSYCYYME